MLTRKLKSLLIFLAVLAVVVFIILARPKTDPDNLTGNIFGNSAIEKTGANQDVPMADNGEPIQIAYTDDNSGENLIIATDKQIYSGFSNSEVHISLTNKDSIDHNGQLLFYFPIKDDTKIKLPATVKKIQVYQAGKWQPVGIFPSPAGSGSTMTGTSSTTGINTDDPTLKDSLAKRKAIPENMTFRGAVDFSAKSGETVYFKAEINYPPGGVGEFFIEGIADRGGYGLLDPWYSSSYSYRRPLIINHNKVSTVSKTTLSNFPVLVNITNADLKTTAFGGNAASGSGEFVFTSSDGVTTLPYEIETYSSSSGQFIGWVKIASLSPSFDTTMYMYYGSSAGGATNQQKTAVWNPNFMGVWHFGDGTTVSYNDSTSNGNTFVAQGTPPGALSVASSKINGGVNTLGTSQYTTKSLISTSAMGNSTNNTVSGWIYINSLVAMDDNPGVFFGVRELSWPAQGLYFRLNYINGNVDAQARNGDTVLTTDASAPSIGAWHYVAGVYDGSTVYYYLDGNLIDSTNGTVTISSQKLFINDSAFSLYNPRHVDMNFDEVRHSASARSADWIATEYNNQSSPNTFIGMNAPQAPTRTAPSVAIVNQGATAVGWYSGCSTPTGGTITTNGTKTVHTFNTSDTFTVGKSGNVEVLVIAGGGGGGGATSANGGGGGGGGGLVYDASFAVTAQAYTVTVGGGGPAGTNGSDSVFSSLTATGGGKGGTYQTAGSNGGSGGGAGRDAGAAAGGTGSQGYDGGQAGGASWGSGGGGGGAGAVGYQGGTDSGNISGTLSQGGAGLAYSISGSSVTYAGGGGGAWQTGTTPANGGAGGGGKGAANSGGVAPTVGTTNTGGGGGGGQAAAGAAGGSGVVIISYETADFYSCASSYLYRRPLIINHNKVSTVSKTTLSNFPVLVNITNSDLKASASGGYIQRSTGNDILFTDSTGSTKLAYELESYNGTTGNVIAWVKIASLSPSFDTTMYMYYNNPTATDQSAATSVWNADYKGVWHFGDGTTLSRTDSTSNGNSLVDTGTAPAALSVASSKINGGVNTLGTSQYTTKGLKSSSVMGNSTNNAISGWIYIDSNSTKDENPANFLGIAQAGWPGPGVYLRLWGDGTVDSMARNGDTYLVSSALAPSIDAWHYVAAVYDGSAVYYYLDGNLIDSTDGAITITNDIFFINDSAFALYTFRHVDMNFDEVRHSASARSADWIATEYNNQGDPGSFVGLGAAQSSARAAPFIKIRGGVQFR